MTVRIFEPKQVQPSIGKGGPSAYGVPFDWFGIGYLGLIWVGQSPTVGERSPTESVLVH